MAMSGVDAADKSNVVAQSVNGNVLSTYMQGRWHINRFKLPQNDKQIFPLLITA